MKIRSTLLTLALLSTTAPSVASASSSFELPSYRPGELCVRNQESGERITKIYVHNLLVYFLHALAPKTFGLVESSERCDDDEDNNCDGSIDESCAPKAVTPWAKTNACDACTQRACDNWLEKCTQDETCLKGVDCMVQSACIGRFLGPASCLCGEGVTVMGCLDMKDRASLEGACVDELLPEGVQFNEDRLPLNELPDVLASLTLICQARFCQDDCKENFWNQ